MGNIDGLREQVEELKQRLNDPESQQTAAPNELKTRLASIKASLESKQGEITQLSAEKQQLAAEKEKFVAELQRLSAENDQLRKMLKDLLSTLDGRPADPATDILSEFLAETDPLINPKGNGGETVIAAGPPSGAATAAPAQAEAAGSNSHGGPAEAADPQAAEQPEANEAPDEEESPALRRIMKRGRRTAG